MSGLTRERSCLYYFPWVALLGICLVAGGAGVWTHYGLHSYDHTEIGLRALGLKFAGVRHYDILYPGIIATVSTTMATLFFLTLLSFLRGFVEAGHDSRGTTGGGASCWMAFTALASTAWWLVTLWLSIALVASIMYTVKLFDFRTSITTLLGKYPTQPSVTYVPSSGLACPGECFNIGTYYSFLTSKAKEPCECNHSLLRQVAAQDLKTAVNDCVAIIVGAWVMLLGAVVVLVDTASQFSHTKRERELIKRAHLILPPF